MTFKAVFYAMFHAMLHAMMFHATRVLLVGRGTALNLVGVCRIFQTY